MCRRRVMLALLVFAVGTLRNASAKDAEFHCARDTHVVAVCSKVSGSLIIPANSRPEITERGTGHVFGLQYPGDLPVVGGQLVPLPENIAAVFAADPSAEVLGDFTICPYTERVETKKQYACVEQAEEIAIGRKK